MIYQLLYVSEISKTFVESDLNDILQSSRINNAEKNISGLLLYNGQFFIQLLEGQKAAVTECFNRIAEDTRHTKTRILFGHPGSKRLFPHWNMGFVKNMAPETLNELLPYLHQTMIKEKDTQMKILNALKRFSENPEAKNAVA